MKVQDKTIFSIICSNTEKARAQKDYIKSSFKILEKPEELIKLEHYQSAIIVIGGDGEMLHAIHNYFNLSIPFIGVNAGSVGFLMNHNISADHLNALDSLEAMTLFPLVMETIDQNGNIEKKIAFNEVSVYRATNQVAKMSVRVNNILQIEELISDGLIIATPAGSSAYNFSAGGRIVPLDSELICITPVCTYRPRRWHGAIIPNNSIIELEIFEHEKRPVNAVADFNEVKNVVKIKIYQDRTIKASLLFSSQKELSERMIKEQFLV